MITQSDIKVGYLVMIKVMNQTDSQKTAVTNGIQKLTNKSWYLKQFMTKIQNPKASL